MCPPYRGRRRRREDSGKRTGEEAAFSFSGGKRTVDGDGNGLSQGKAVLALEGGDLAEGVGLEQLGSRVGGVDNLNLQIDVVGLCNRLDGGAAGVVLEHHE